MDSSRNESTTKMYGLRQAYLNLPINAETDGDKIWVKKLQNILASDIHSKPLGCKVEDTHVKIREVHLGTFYEAQILFSHNYWVSRFADWLTDRILEKAKETKKIVLIGYETYVEPVLYRIERKIKEKDDNIIVKYLIYEEKKYIQTDKTTNDSRIRYADEYNDDKKEEAVNDTLFVFICGISSTLATFDKMKKKLSKESLGFKGDNECVNYSIIQVLPNNYDKEGGKRFFELDDEKRIEWRRENGTNKINRLFEKIVTISAEFLAEVYCEWQTAGKCKWCYPEVPLEERPIIETSETSVIPTQLIQEHRSERVDNNFDKRKKEQWSAYEKSLNFFEKDEIKGYKYKKYLYYDHIDRDGHHYQYYFRTGHLFRKIFSDDHDRFKKDCDQIRRRIGEEDIKNSVNVIVSPRHFSDGMFPQAINDYVFDKSAHIISLDIKKEYRSNFRTKYSNYAYFLDQVRGTDKKLNFYFVDDQIISGATFYRAKSLITSLMREYENDKRLNIFAGIFVLINRMSKETKRDYISDANKFFSLIDIFIPSIRSYGDSCPICKLNKDAEEYQQKSALSSSAYHWSHRREHHCIKTLDDVKEQQKNRNEKNESGLSDRHFIRLAVENTLWGGFLEKDQKGGNDKIVKGISEYQSKEEVLTFFSEVVNCNKYYESVELMISFFKAISRAFIYYRENAKKAALKILISFIQYLTENGNSTKKGITIDGVRFEDINIKSNCERYSLLVILINALASLDSTYLISADRILSIYNCVLDWQNCAEIYLCSSTQDTEKSRSDLCRFIDSSKYVLRWRVVEGNQTNEYQVESFYSVILNAYKRIICGISGEQKLNKFNQMLKEYGNMLYRDKSKRIIVCASEEESEDLEKCELYNLTLLKAMMLESVNEIKSLKDIDAVDKVEKYKSCAQALVGEINTDGTEDTLKLTFYYYDAFFGDCFIEMKGDARKRKLADIFGFDQKTQDLAIKNSLLANGFYHVSEKDKWMVDLRHFESDFAEGISSGNDEKYMCLLFEFESKGEDDEAKKTFAQIEAVKNILKYRYWLTEDIDRDIRTGSIKSSIQAKKAKSLLDSGKTVMHGGNADLIQILQTTYGEIKDCRTKSRYDFVRICDMANSMMNMLISYANIHIVNEDYFAMGKSAHGPFLREVKYLNNLNDDEQVHQRRLLYEYFKEITNCESSYLKHVVKKAERNDVQTIEVKFCSADQDADGTNDIEDCLDKITMFPCMFNRTVPEESCVFFIAIIDLFLRNAAKHGKSDDHKIKVGLNISELNSEAETGYSLSLINEKRDEALGDKNPITWKVLEYFSGLKKLEGLLDGFTIERTPPKEEGDIFTATLSCKCKKEESPLLDIIFN